MARRDLNLDDEKRSYAGLWFLCAAFLVIGAAWAILDDAFFRRPWKDYQHGYYALAEAKERAKLEAEEEKLEADPEYTELEQKLAEAEAQLASPETVAKLADANRRLIEAKVKAFDADLQVRFVKSELEAAWYEYDDALETGGNAPAAAEHRDRLIEQRSRDEKAWKDAKAVVAKIEAEIDEIDAPVKKVKKALAEREVDRLAVETRLGAMKSVIANIEMKPIATIKQIVLPDFDVNNFDQPVDRVDRCTSCHMAIDKVGFEDAEQPWTTHPERDPLLTQHPPGKFGCTSCHDGQGVGLNSVRQAHGEVLFFLRPLLKGTEQQARCLNCHRDVERLPGAKNLAAGEFLFEQLGCHGCHLVEGYDGLPRVGPTLRRVSAKVDPQWMVNWIRDPYAFRPRTRMPHFEFSDAQSRAAAAYLWSSSKKDGEQWLKEHPDPGGIEPRDTAQVERGRQLVDSVGCRACHAVAPGEVATPIGVSKDYGPNLTKVGLKTSPRFLYWWIKDPRGYNPESRMPSLRLSDREARDIVAYLLSLSAGMERPEPTVTASTLADADLVEEGEAIVRRYGCYGYHAINGMDAESRVGVELSTFAVKPLEELYFGINPEIPRTWNAWTYNKLKNPRIYATEHVAQMMPNFRLEEEDILNLRVWLASRTGAQPPIKYRAAGHEGRQKVIQKGRRVLQRYNCTGCHVIDDQGGYVRRLYEDNPTLAPPILNGQGAKVQPEWFFGFLQDPSRQPLRFWLKIRMPTFGMSEEEATAIVNYFAARADLRDPYFFWDPGVDSTPEMLKVGEMLMSDEYFSCWACHVRGDQTPSGPMEQWAPNLAYAHERLNPNWILSWIKDPQAIMPGTKMPAFYPGGPPDVFAGDEDRQVAAIRDYIMSLGVSQASVQAKGEAAPDAGADGEAVDGADQTEASIEGGTEAGPG